MNEGTESEQIDVLLVDDRQENLLALEAVLSNPNYNLIKATSGDEALKYLLKHDPAIILLDVQMPGLDGFETASLIKQCERTREIPIIFITALNKSENYVHKGYEHGAVDYIYKPFDVTILKSKVAIFAELFRKTQRLLYAERQLRDTERKEREGKLAQLELKSLRREQANERKYKDLVEGINHGFVWSTDSNLRSVCFISPSVQSILGYSAEDLLVRENFLINHIYPEDRELFLSAVYKVIHQWQDTEIEHRFIRSDGQIIWLHTGIRLAFKEEPSEIELRGLSVDITKMKNAEEALQQSKKRSDFMAEASLLLSETLDCETALSRVGILAVHEIADWYAIDLIEKEYKFTRLSVNSTLFTQNEYLNQINKVTCSNLLDNSETYTVLNTGKSKLYTFLSDEKIAKLVILDKERDIFQNIKSPSGMIVPLIARGKTLGTMTFVSCNSDRKYSEIDLTMVEDLARRVAISLDNANLYKQAQAAIHARDEFLSIASHELKTPITPLKIQTQGLIRALDLGSFANFSPEKIRKIFQTFDRQLTRLSKLIEDLLDISRINFGRLTLTIEEFDIIELIEDTIDRFSDLLVNSKCEVKLDAIGPLFVHLDRFRIEQVIINLLTNSIKYGPGKPIQISVKHHNNSIVLSFQDNGIGIAKEDQSRIFERFERAVSGSHFGGLGLGLYIVTQILAAHGGKIDVESELGNGSTFTVQLPLHFSPEKAQSEGSAA